MTWIVVVTGIWVACSATVALLLGVVIGRANRQRRSIDVDHIRDDS